MSLKEEIENAVEELRKAHARAQLARKALLLELPEEVQIAYHYNGGRAGGRAAREYPEYEKAFTALKAFA